MGEGKGGLLSSVDRGAPHQMAPETNSWHSGAQYQVSVAGTLVQCKLKSHQGCG